MHKTTYHFNYWLKQDVRGTVNRVLYGKKGDQIKLVSIRGNVAIVDNSKEKFPVSVVLISETKIDPETEPEDIQANAKKSTPKKRR